MDVVHSLWEEKSAIQRVKLFESRCSKEEGIARAKDDRSLFPCCDSNLNFSTATCSEDDSEYGPFKKTKVPRQDPLSHRIIEKRRRDRMNNCLADLSRLIPKEYLKKGRGRIEKTEIIEMAIKHLQYLQEQHDNPLDHFRLGYQECMSETMRFMVEVEGHFPREAMCVRLLNHLQKHCETLSRTPPVQQSTPLNLMNIRLQKSPGHSVIQSNEAKLSDFEHEVNNNTFDEQTNSFPESDDKHSDINGVSYKYKTDIKLRFSQDLHAVEKCTKPGPTKKRRNSMTSIENNSFSHSSPPSDIFTRNSSESENTVHSISPTENNTCGENGKNDIHDDCSVILKPFSRNKVNNNEKSNFNIPIFVLHAKGSFYIPLTIDYKTLLPFLQNYDILEVYPGLHNIVLHPVTINVNFQTPCGIKCTNYKFHNNTWN